LRPGPGAGERDVGELGDAEVENLHHAVVGHEHVRRLDVAVYDPSRVRFREPPRDLHRDPHRLANRERPARDTLLQCLPIVERHRQVELPIVSLADLVDRADVRVLK
jgi:hypothetical protein